MSQPTSSGLDPIVHAPADAVVESEPTTQSLAPATAIPPTVVAVDEYRLARPVEALPPIVAPVAPLEVAPPRLSSHPTPAAVAIVDKPRRLAALDVFRGITIAAMVLANSSNDPYPWMDHAKWHGWTPTDLIFPFFLFIVGVATPFSLAKRSATPDGVGYMIGRIWIRALSLILLGHLLAATYVPLPFRDGPAGFAMIKGLRIFGFVFAYAAILALLTPWPWRRLTTWLPVAIALVLYGYLIAMHFVRAHALANGWPADTFGGGSFNPDKFRIPGVLVRIGICYGIAATVALFAGWRTIVGVILALFIAYSAVMLAVPIHRLDNGERVVGSLTEEDNVARRVDVGVFERWTTDPITGKPVATQKHTWRDYPDNEGILSTLPAIATALMGVLVGRWLRTPRTSLEHVAGLLAWSVPVIILGCVLDVTLMPINKNLWTPSFTVFTAGLAMLGLGFVFYLTDVLGRRAWAFPFTVMGMNAIAAFAASTLVVRVCSFIEVPDVALVPIRTSVEPVNASVNATVSADATHPINAPKLTHVPLNTYASHEVSNVVRRASNALVNVTRGHGPLLATSENLSLAWSLCFLGVIFLITLLLYACRIFVKV